MSDIRNAFTEKNSGELIYLTSETITAAHAFTTRFGGVSAGVLSSLNLGENRGDDPENVRENYRRLLSALSLDGLPIAFARQVHGAGVLTADKADAHELFAPIPYEADALVTGETGLALVVFIADCVPVLLHDPSAGVIAAVHCGWRGTVADILKNTVDAMMKLGSCPKSIRAAIGPSIGACCFEVGPEVTQAIEALLGPDAQDLYRPRENFEGKFLADLRGVCARRLETLGLRAGSIAVSSECTMCGSDKYWSHRAAKGARGSQAAIIAR